MTLEPGTRLGVYEILAPIGKGGMGEVYRARDTKLGREVAIKILSTDFADDRERLDRFEREARLLAQLNHPNIATLHGLEEAEGQQFLVMELVDGETLAERIRRGPIPPRQALPLFLQTAEALEAAHAKGIVHRDIKPENIAITSEGHVKILDFGLGKRMTGLGASPPTSTAESLQSLTESGTILGTVAYMSPEQTRGEALDSRTDIWSFGAVAYEALTGDSAFHGGSLSETLAAILNKEPDWNALPHSVPHLLRRLIHRCLEKDKHARTQHMGDARLELQELVRQPSGEQRLDVPMEVGSKRMWRVAALTAAVAAAAAFAVTVLRTNDVERRVVRLTFRPENPLSSAFRAPQKIAISPDGGTVAYAGEDQIYLRDLERLEERALETSEGRADNLAFSPDGRWLAYRADNKIKKVPVGGGRPTTIAEASPITMSWGSDDVIRYGSIRGIQEVSTDGGDPTPIAMDDKSEEVMVRPTLVPGTRLLLCLVGVNPDASQILEVRSRDGGEVHVLNERVYDYRYTESGHIIYNMSSGAFYVARFDPERLEMSGPVQIPEMIDQDDFDVALDGTLVYRRSTDGRRYSLVWVNRSDGTTAPATNDLQDFARPRISPDGQKVAVEIREPGDKSDIWVYDLSRGTKVRLMNTETADFEPVWTPDGARIVYTSRSGDRSSARLDLNWKSADGSGNPETLLSSDSLKSPHSWHPSARLLAFYVLNREEGSPRVQAAVTERDIWLLPLEGDKDPVPFRATRFNERSPSFSPNGRYLAYVSDESGRDEIYVEPYPGPGNREVVSTDGGREPVWSRDGSELFYRNGNRFMAVEVDTSESFRAGVPEELFSGNFFTDDPESGSGSQSYDVSPDSQRFLVVRPDDTPPEFVVVLNWLEELKRLVPAED